MIISAHWKVYNKAGNVIDLIERELADMVGANNVSRTEVCRGDNYEATFTVKGNIEIPALVDACEYMKEVGANPI